jgi:hypothetical protein
MNQTEALNSLMLALGKHSNEEKRHQHCSATDATLHNDFLARIQRRASFFPCPGLVSLQWHPSTLSLYRALFL